MLNCKHIMPHIVPPLLAPLWSHCSLQTGYMFGKGVYFADMVTKVTVM